MTFKIKTLSYCLLPASLLTGCMDLDLNSLVITPTPSPTATMAPTATPTQAPTATATPTRVPTQAITATPTQVPTATATPTRVPTQVITATPTQVPTSTATPTRVPTQIITATPTQVPTATATPTRVPTQIITATPTQVPTATPTRVPTQVITATPTQAPTPIASYPDYIRGTTVPVNGEIYRYQGQCWRAQNGPGAWDAPTQGWFWNKVECGVSQPTQVVTATPSPTVTATPVVTPIQGQGFEVLSPLPNTVLTKTELVLQLSQAANVYVYVGDAPESMEYGAQLASQTELVFSGLPQDGRTLYVTLWQDVRGDWQPSSFAIQAMLAPGVTQVPTPSPTATPEPSPWTHVSVPMQGPYGERTFRVPAAQHWVNTGLYLKAGETAQIDAEGQWSLGGAQYGPDGDPNNRQRGCQKGELAARQGLYYDDSLVCIGSGGSYRASKDGILFVGSVASTDLGEFYGTREQAKGAVNVTVRSNANTAPTIDVVDIGAANLDRIRSGWFELKGDHVILTLPVDVAKGDQAHLAAAVERLDDIYRTHRDLRQAEPYFGQPTRFFPDTKDAPGWMLAGNPIRMDPALITGSSRITLAGQPGQNNWGFAHELGHNFNVVGGNWYYMSGGFLEAWPNVFTVHAVETLGLIPRDLNCVEKKAKYLQSGNYSEHFAKDVWLSLCFFMELKDDYGWPFYTEFYRLFDAAPSSGWPYLKRLFEQASGDNLSAKFREWKIPH